jgi:hypothetical protein
MAAMQSGLDAYFSRNAAQTALGIMPMLIMPST